MRYDRGLRREFVGAVGRLAPAPVFFRSVRWICDPSYAAAPSRATADVPIRFVSTPGQHGTRQVSVGRIRTRRAPRVFAFSLVCLSFPCSQRPRERDAFAISMRGVIWKHAQLSLKHHISPTRRVIRYVYVCIYIYIHMYVYICIYIYIYIYM